MKLSFSRFDIVINIACLALIVGSVINLIVAWNTLPDQFPAQYDFAGNVTRWGGKGELIAMPVIAWVSYLLLSIIERFPQIWNTGVKVTEANKERVYRTMKSFLSVTKLILVAPFVLILLNTTLSDVLHGWWIVYIILTVVSIVFFFVKLIRASRTIM